MARIGIVPLLAVALFGLAIPLVLYRLNRRFGLWPVVVVALGIGLAYGALKADSPWSGDGLVANFELMGASAIVLIVYVALSVGAARLVAKAILGGRS